MEKYTFVFKRSLTNEEKAIKNPDFYVYDDESRTDKVSFVENKAAYSSYSELYTCLYNKLDQYVKNSSYDNIEVVSLTEDNEQPETVVEVFIWNGVTQNVRISNPAANVKVVVHNCDEDYSNKFEFDKKLASPKMHEANWLTENFEEET